ncbi:MAG: cation diffusion facilitator family transporter [Deferrisomatales bacterium]|nr:cation diffusion facilitator family transporter [Deferrisomatales bacterium]
MSEDHVHGAHCGHSQGGGAAPGARRNLLLALVLTLSFMVAEAVGGWLTNSLALLSDAGHMLTDAGALGLALLALRIGQMPPSATKTFGYRRVEILAALLNGLALWAIVGVILREAWERFRDPREIHALGMMAVAALGLAVNLVSLRLLHRHKDASLNVRGAFVHVLADSLGSVGVLAAGVVIATTGWTLADPLVSVVICGLILWASWGLVRDAVHVLLLGVPPHLDLRRVERAILEEEGVCCLYDLHLWSIAPGREALSAHVVVPDGYSRQRELLDGIVRRLREGFGIDHATIQIEETHEMKSSRADTVCAVPGQGASCALLPDPPAGPGRGPT